MDPVESHGLTSLMRHVLGEDFTRGDYLQNIPFYEPLRREKSRFDLGPLAEKFPSQAAPTFALLTESDDAALLNTLRGGGQAEVGGGVLMDTSMLGQPPTETRQKKKEEGEKSKTKISLKVGAMAKKKLKLKLPSSSSSSMAPASKPS
ncbi:hypothetical protein M9434_004657 [Picochlorum sp. BPE23]|nr:hypothetical protein M9434_004657 [Picochlorum sp. BPE23]